MTTNRHLCRVCLAIFACIFSLLTPQLGNAGRLASANHPLMNQFDQPFEFQDLLGKPSVVHFGFTNCAAICPTMLNGMAIYMQKLGRRADQFNFVFVTVDPERDTTVILREYIGHFDNRIIGVTGSVESIARLAKTFGTRYEKRAAEGGSYQMSHAIFAYLIDKAGKKVGTLYMGPDSQPNAVMLKLTRLLD